MSLDTHSATKPQAYRFSVLYFILLAIGLISIYFIFQEGIIHAVQKWDTPEYSHAYLIPLISLFIVWQKNNQIIKQPFPGSWWGTLIVVAGLFFWLLGETSTLYVIIK